MTGIENHDSLIGQHDEGRIIVIIGLEVRTDEHIGLAMVQPVVLGGLHIAMHINIANIGGIDSTCLVFIMQSAGIGKPAPGAFLGYDILTIEIGKKPNKDKNTKDPFRLF